VIFEILSSSHYFKATKKCGNSILYLENFSSKDSSNGAIRDYLNIF